MKKKSTLGFILLLLSCLVFWGGSNLPLAYGRDVNQATIPTRTPTPLPPTATQPGGGNNPTPTVKNTAAPQSSPTSTLLPVQIAPTPVGGFLPTAVPCSSNPTIQTLGATNVRNGPGLQYEVIGQLVYLEVRYIVGRADSAQWWLIQFNNGQFGWVADEIVLVQGYTPILPLVEAPPLPGGTPTPGAAWNPTPIPFCTVTPPPTNTPTASPSAPASNVAETTPTMTATPTESAPTVVRPTDTPIVQPTAVSPNPAATVAITDPTEDNGNGNSGNLILLGIGLFLGGGLIFFFLRRRS